MPTDRPVESYITETLRTYREPSRGKGFSRVKLEASLRSALTGETLREIAERLGVGYEVLRVWASQDDFKRQVDTNLQEFEAWFSDQLKAIDPNKPLRFRDTAMWGEHATGKIARALKKYAGTNGKREALFKSIGALRRSLPEWHYPRNRKNVRVMMMFAKEDDPKAKLHGLQCELAAEMQDRIVKVINESRASESDRNEALRLLETLLAELRGDKA